MLKVEHVEIFKCWMLNILGWYVVEMCVDMWIFQHTTCPQHHISLAFSTLRMLKMFKCWMLNILECCKCWNVDRLTVLMQWIFFVSFTGQHFNLQHFNISTLSTFNMNRHVEMLKCWRLKYWRRIDARLQHETLVNFQHVNPQCGTKCWNLQMSNVGMGGLRGWRLRQGTFFNIQHFAISTWHEMLTCWNIEGWIMEVKCCLLKYGMLRGWRLKQDTIFNIQHFNMSTCSTFNMSVLRNGTNVNNVNMCKCWNVQHSMLNKTCAHVEIQRWNLRHAEFRLKCWMLTMLKWWRFNMLRRLKCWPVKETKEIHCMRTFNLSTFQHVRHSKMFNIQHFNIWTFSTFQRWGCQILLTFLKT